MEQHRVRRRLVAPISVATLIAGALVLAGVGPARAVEDVEADRIAGLNRFETAAEVAAAGFDGGSDTVLVASGRAFPDALAGAALGLPILLTERDSLPSATADAIDDLGANDIIILGGPAAVSDRVEDDLSDHGTVSRLAGANRYETAADIATSLGADGVAAVDDLPTAIIATGLGFADALAGGPLATGVGGADALPILLVDDEVPAATADAIETLGIEQVLILGGTAAVPDSVQAELEELTGNDAVRLAGTNRYETATEVGEFAIATLEFPTEEVLLASGLEFADALAGGPLGALRQAPLLLTDPVQLSEETEAFLVEHADTVALITTLGGTAAVSNSAANAAEAAAETPVESAANEDIDVAPAANVDQANGSTRTYTISGLGTQAVDVALAPCGAVRTSASGDTTFSNANNNAIADGTARDADSTDEADFPGRISSVNGSPEAEDSSHTVRNDDYIDDEPPDASGKVTFVVTGPSSLSISSTCVRPVAFIDENSDDGLSLQGGVPSELFGTGGEVRFSPGAASSGFFDVNVDDNNDSINKFSGCTIESQGGGIQEIINEAECASWTYDDNDTFQINGSPSTIAAFELMLSVNDDVKGSYTTVPANKSVFNLYQNDAPVAPTKDPSEPVNPEVSGSTVTFHLIESTTTTTDEYVLYRYTKAAVTETCPAFYSQASTFTRDSRYVLVTVPQSRYPDANAPGGRFDMLDFAAPIGTNCYHAISVEDSGEGPPGTVMEAIVTSSTTPPPSSGAPILTNAFGSDKGVLGVLDANDVHELRFSEAMRPDATPNYTVTDNDTPPSRARITCGGNAQCVWNSGATVLRVLITAKPAVESGLELPGPDGDVDYPMTVTAASFADAGGTALDLTSTSDEPVIEAATLSGDTTPPIITAAQLTTDPTPVPANTWEGDGDVMTLTFGGESITLKDADGNLDQAQVRAVTGDDTITFGTGTVVKAAGQGSSLTLEVDVAPLTTGVQAGGANMDGSYTNEVFDSSGNAEAPNPNPVKLQT